MEGFRRLADSVFEKEQWVRDPPPRYKYSALELSEDIIGETEITESRGETRSNDRSLVPKPQDRWSLLTLAQHELRAWFLSNSRNLEPEVLPNNTTKARLKLLRLGRQPDMSLTISRAVFNELLYCMKADPSVKYMICRNYDGFHEYHGRGFLLTRFIGTSVYALVWTFDPTTLTTRMLFLQRQNRQDTFPLFVDLVRAHRAYIFTPSFPCYLSCHFLLHISDHDAGGWELGVIRHVEEQTGFGLHPFGWRGVEPLKLVEKFNINQLTSWLQAVNEVAMNASNRSRHQNNSYVLLEVIKAEHKNGGRHYGILPGKALQLHQEKMEELIEALPALERHIAAYIDFEVYFKQRADRLSSVLFALMTHEDANASIGLAAATRNDSASMKTIAIMTMAFLPATFFAALFSMPSLRWDQPAVVQDRFWVYWAFTVPTTIAVFLVWLLITKRKWIFRGIGGLLMKHGVGVQHVNMK